MEEKAIDKKYTEFIETLIDQIGDVLPTDINKLQQDYLVNNIRNSSNLLAKSMQEDEVFKKLDFETQKEYIQIMAEWSFHKEIDLFRSGIGAKHWKMVMQKIWYTTWEVMYACIQNNAPQDVLLNLVERYVNRTYQDAIEELKDTNLIDKETEEKAKEQSNIDIMAEEYRKQRRKKRILKHIYRIILMFLVSFSVTMFVLAFKIYGVIIVLSATVFYVLVSHTKEE